MRRRFQPERRSCMIHPLLKSIKGKDGAFGRSDTWLDENRFDNISQEADSLNSTEGMIPSSCLCDVSRNKCRFRTVVKFLDFKLAWYFHTVNESSYELVERLIHLQIAGTFRERSSSGSSQESRWWRQICSARDAEFDPVSAVIVGSRSCSKLQGMNSIAATPMRVLLPSRSSGAERANYLCRLGNVGVVCFSKNSRVADSKESTPPSTSKSRQCLGRTLIWFHHIKSAKKKRDIKEWAEELKLGGFCKPGFPGVLIFEGERENVAEYVRRIKRLRWQHLQIRGQEEEEVLTEGQDLDSRRRFPLGVKELSESGMSELAEKCREANLEQLYLTAFKISR